MHYGFNNSFRTKRCAIRETLFAVTRIVRPIGREYHRVSVRAWKRPVEDRWSWPAGFVGLAWPRVGTAAEAAWPALGLAILRKSGTNRRRQRIVYRQNPVRTGTNPRPGWTPVVLPAQRRLAAMASPTISDERRLRNDRRRLLPDERLPISIWTERLQRRPLDSCHSIRPICTSSPTTVRSTCHRVPSAPILWERNRCRWFRRHFSGAKDRSYVLALLVFSPAFPRKPPVLRSTRPTWATARLFLRPTAETRTCWPRIRRLAVYLHRPRNRICLTLRLRVTWFRSWTIRPILRNRTCTTRLRYVCEIYNNIILITIIV